MLADQWQNFVHPFAASPQAKTHAPSCKVCLKGLCNRSQCTLCCAVLSPQPGKQHARPVNDAMAILQQVKIED